MYYIMNDFLQCILFTCSETLHSHSPGQLSIYSQFQMYSSLSALGMELDS